MGVSASQSQTLSQSQLGTVVVMELRDCLFLPLPFSSIPVPIPISRGGVEGKRRLGSSIPIEKVSELCGCGACLVEERRPTPTSIHLRGRDDWRVGVKRLLLLLLPPSALKKGDLTLIFKRLVGKCIFQ